MPIIELRTFHVQGNYFHSLSHSKYSNRHSVNMIMGIDEQHRIWRHRVNLFYFNTVAIPLSLKTLTVIKWKDENGMIQNFHLVTRACKKWKRMGILLDKNIHDLKDIEREQKEDEMCWCSLMEEWIISGGCSSYPVTWEGLYSLLVDVESLNIAKLLKRAVIKAIPLPNLGAAEATGTLLSS